MKAIEVNTLAKRHGQARSVEEGEIFSYLDPNRIRMAP